LKTVYLNAIESFLNEAKIESLVLRGLENHTNTQLPQFVQPNAVLEIPECVQFARIVLREQAWGRLVNPKKAYVHLVMITICILVFQNAASLPNLNLKKVVIR
jgi:hypothetical protein